MMVVSDTSPLTALLQVNQAELLTKLFGEIVIPAAVHAELMRSHTRLPPWLQVVTVINPGQVKRFARSLDMGEAEAIELAQRTSVACWVWYFLPNAVNLYPPRGLCSCGSIRRPACILPKPCENWRSSRSVSDCSF